MASLSDAENELIREMENLAVSGVSNCEQCLKKSEIIEEAKIVMQEILDHTLPEHQFAMEDKYRAWLNRITHEGIHIILYGKIIYNIL